MQLGKHHLNAGHAQLFVNAYRNTSAVVLNSNGVVLMQGHAYRVRISVCRLVHSVVHYLPKHMMKAA